MVIAQISDTHIAYDTPDRAQRLSDFKAVIGDINSLDPQPDVIIHTGDVVHNGRTDEYTTAATILAEAKAPTFVMMGNKDERSNMRKVFSSRNYFDPHSPFIDYSIDDYPVRLIALDTASLNSNKGDFCAVRALNLSRMIEADPDKPIALFTHHPPFEVLVGPQREHFESADKRKKLCQALQHSKRIIAIFSGHVHRATSGFVDQIPASVMTAVSTTLRWDTYPNWLHQSPTYQIHRYEGTSGFISETRIVRS